MPRALTRFGEPGLSIGARPLRASRKRAWASWAWPLLLRRDVTVRIMVEEAGQRRIVRVEGRLTVAELAELEGALGDDLTHAELELQNLRSADAGGLAALRRLRDAGVVLRSVPPRIAYAIDDEG